MLQNGYLCTLLLHITFEKNGLYFVNRKNFATFVSWNRYAHIALNPYCTQFQTNCATLCCLYA